MRISRISFILAALFALCAGGDIHAQWTNVAPGIASGINFGAIHYKSGILWAGNSALYSSPDLGKSWTINSFNSFSGGGTIQDIQFYDNSTGIISTLAGLFLTTDGGLTWNEIGYAKNCRSIAFGGTSSVIYALQNSPPSFNVSYDGGLNWYQTTFISSEAMSLVVAKDNTIYVFLYYYGSRGQIMFSTDQGATWTLKNGVADGDTYSMAADSCNSGLLYLANEENAVRGNGVADLYRSSDDGDFWQSTFSRPIKYLVGSITATSHTVYAGGSEGNLLRSTDHGLTWKELPAPPQHFDTHNIACVDDNTVFIIGDDGSIWKTTNSAGDSLASFPANGTFTVTPDTVFVQDTISCGESVTRQLALTRRGCAPPSISGWNIIGVDSVCYQAGNLTLGFLGCTFSSKHPGKNSASLIVSFNDDTKDTIALRGYNNTKPFSYSATPQNLFTADSTYLCSAKTEKFILTCGGCLPKIVSQVITGANPNDYHFIRQIANPLYSTDTAIISFTPGNSGARNAIYEITFDNGTTLQVPLQGFGIAPQPLSLATADQKTDTIGGTVYAPIIVNGLKGAEDVELIVHYDGKLFYRGSYSPADALLDLPSAGLMGRSKLHITKAMTGKILGYARFDVFSDSLLPKFSVTFDSISVLTEKAPCQYILPVSPVTSTITPPLYSACGTRTLIHFMLDSSMPQFSLSPNPAGGDVSIISSRDVGEVSIVMYDMMGAKRGESTAILKKNNPVKVILPTGNGIYNLRVHSSGMDWDLRVVVNR